MNKDLIKYGLLALGAYLVYKYIQDHGGLAALGIGTGGNWERPPAPGTTTGANPPVVTGTAPPPVYTAPPPVYVAPPPVYQPPAPIPNIKDRLAAAATGTDPSFLHLDGWCYYFAQVTGQPCPDPNEAWPSVDRSAPISLDTFWGLMGPWLASNMPNLSGLGSFHRGYTPAWLM